MVYVARCRQVPANGATEVCPRDRCRRAPRPRRSASRRRSEAAEPLPLDKLAPEVLNIIAEALAADEDVLIPRHLGSLARSCKVIKEAVGDAKDKLKVEYDAASGAGLSSATRIRSSGLWRSGLHRSIGTTRV